MVDAPSDPQESRLPTLTAAELDEMLFRDDITRREYSAEMTRRGAGRALRRFAEIAEDARMAMANETPL